MPQNIKYKWVSKCQRTSYSIGQKEEVISYAKNYGRNNAAAYFELDKSMVGRWVKASASWTSEVSRNSKKIGSSWKVFYSKIEKKLYNWIIE